MRRCLSLLQALGSLALTLTLSSCSSSSDETPEPAPVPPLMCNGHAELCDRRFDQVSFPATHNSMSNGDESWVVPNQHHAIGKQLDDGIRVFLIDSHEFEGAAYLCHQICKFGSIKLTDALGLYRSFLEAHPHEVLTLIIEDYITADQTAQAMADSGLLPYVFVHSQGEAFPTLRKMITDNTRVFVTAESGGPPPAWYHHVWDVTSDTPYDYATAADIDAKGCDKNRGDLENPLFLVNHWLSTPLADPKSAEQVNPYAALSAHVKRCQQQRNRLPNFVAVDYYDIGDLFRVVDELNGFLGYSVEVAMRCGYRRGP